MRNVIIIFKTMIVNPFLPEGRLLPLLRLSVNIEHLAHRQAIW